MLKEWGAVAAGLVLQAELLPAGGLVWAAADLEEGVKDLAEKIVKGMSDKGTRKIAIIDFSDLDARVTALGQFMAEELTAQLFLVAPGKFEVVERRQLLKLEEELALGPAGVIEEKSLKKMGQVLGVEAVVTGSMTDLGSTIKVNARMIAVESAKVFAVAATSIPKTGIVADLASKAVERRPGGSALAAAAPAASASKPIRVQAAMSVEVNNFLFALQGCKIRRRPHRGDRSSTRARHESPRESDGGSAAEALLVSARAASSRSRPFAQ
jgi:TolB-like protein